MSMLSTIAASRALASGTNNARFPRRRASIATGKTPDLIAPFALERFHTDTPVSELAAAAVSH